MIHYYPKPIPITAEQEKVLKNIAIHNSNEWLKQPHITRE